MPVAVEEAAAATAGGKLYVIGGFDAAGNSLQTVWVFDGSAWSAGPGLQLGLDHSSAAVMDDHVYVAGGHYFGRDSARVFRLDGGSWTELASMHHARGGHALLAAAGRLYAIGGNTASANVLPAEVYDPGSNAWSDLPPLPTPRNHVSGFVFGANVCVAGGRSPATTRVDCFNFERRRGRDDAGRRQRRHPGRAGRRGDDDQRPVRAAAQYRWLELHRRDAGAAAWFRAGDVPGARVGLRRRLAAWSSPGRDMHLGALTERD